MSSIVTEKELVLKAESQFKTLLESMQQHSQERSRIDQVERDSFSQLLELGATLLKVFVAKAGDGDEGEQVEHDGKTLRRSEEPQRRFYSSIFGKLEIDRFVYAPGIKKKTTYKPVDAQLGLPQSECSYVLEDWLEQLCVKEPFHEAAATLESIFRVRPSLRTAELHNRRMAQHAESFLASESHEAVPAKAQILVATADGTSVPMKTSDRTKQPASHKGPKAGTTRRAYVGAVYEIEPFVRDTISIMDELFRDEAEAKRPRPMAKHLWAEMAAAPESLFSGTQRLFAELGMEVHQRDPEGEHVLVSLMDGERHLWELQSDWLGRAIEILDFFHVLERIREVAKFAETELSRREAWVQRQVRDLLDGRVKNVITRWQRLANKENAPAEVKSAVTYFQNNQHRMQYDEYLAAGYPIGSGMAEGACRNLVKDRMDCTGMHWSLEGAQAMLWTRALYLNGKWNDFVEHRIQKEQNQIYHTAA